MSTEVTPEIVDYIKSNYLKMSRKAIAKHFGFSTTVCNTVYKNYNLIVPEELIKEFKKNSLTGRTTFTAEEDQFIKDNYLTMPIKTMASHINRSYCGITGRMRENNLVLPKELIEQRKIDSCYKPGSVPFNKGKKITEFMSAEAIEKSKVHRFKKGNVPANALPEGTEVLRKDKRGGRIYTLIKLPGLKKLKYKHIHIWETHHKKKLPPKHNIVFKDGNTQNLEIENLECISHEELMNRNTIHRYPEDLKKNIRLIGKLKKIIHENGTRTED